MTDTFFSAEGVTGDVTPAEFDVLILGIGNLLWADEGFGVRAVEHLHEGWQFPSNVLLMDGGTQGLYLLPYLEASKKILILDAVDYGLPPATIKQVENDDVPRFMGAKKMSLHQTGFQEVLAVAMLRGWEPEDMILLGMQPDVLEDYGGSLTDKVKDAFPQAIEKALGILEGWGVGGTKRNAPPTDAERIAFRGLDMHAYESGRPSEEAACRIGDDRFMQGS